MGKARTKIKIDVSHRLTSPISENPFKKKVEKTSPPAIKAFTQRRFRTTSEQEIIEKATTKGPAIKLLSEAGRKL